MKWKPVCNQGIDGWERDDLKLVMADVLSSFTFLLHIPTSGTYLIRVVNLRMLKWDVIP